MADEDSSTLGLIIKIIIGVLVLFIIFYLLFHQQIWDYFNNLPGYKYDTRDRVIENITKDTSLLINYYKVAVIPDGKNIKLCSNGDCKNLRNSGLYWNGNEKEGKIYTDINWAFDKKIGDVVNNKITIDSEVLNGGDLYLKVKNQLPDYVDLLNLDNSIYISGVIYRDKKVEVKPEDKIFGRTTITASADRGASFYENINNLKVNEIYVASGNYQFQVNYMFSQETYDCNIRFEKMNDKEFKVEAGYVDSNGRTVWHQLDCNKKGWVGKTMTLDMFKESMIGTVDENCKW